MYEMPKHLPMPVDAAGNGPASPEDMVAIVCWCGVPGCEAYEVQ